MEWKKEGKVLGVRHGSQASIQISFSVHDKQTKRRKKSKHKKILTEAATTYAPPHNSQQLRKLLTKTHSDEHSTSAHTHASAFKSNGSSIFKSGFKPAHSASNSAFLDLERLATDFQQENDRLRRALEEFGEWKLTRETGL